MFLIVTVGAPLMFALFTVVPILISSIKAGGPVRIAVSDETGRMYERVRETLTGGRDEDDDDDVDAAEVATRAGANSNTRIEQASKSSEQGFAVEQVTIDGRTREEVTRQLDERVKKEELDAYIILPKDIATSSEVLFF